MSLPSRTLLLAAASLERQASQNHPRRHLLTEAPPNSIGSETVQNFVVVMAICCQARAFLLLICLSGK